MEWKQPNAIRRFGPRFIAICIVQLRMVMVNFGHWPHYSLNWGTVGSLLTPRTQNCGQTKSRTIWVRSSTSDSQEWDSDHGEPLGCLGLLSGPIC